MQTVRTMIGARRGIAAPAIRAALVAAGALLTCGCNTTQQVAGVPEVPTDYRMRYPISIREADRTLQIFVGSNRSELTPSQRAELLAFAQTWRREATGGVVVDLPVGGSNERAAADALREIQSIVVASGVPPQGVIVRNYRAGERTLGRRNLAAMVDNPADLVQPRAETPAYTMRRTTVVEKYRQGVSHATTVEASNNSSKISEVGK
jgi:pilus assembly protein CpaD